MLFPGRIPLNAAETAALDELLAQSSGSVTITRRDPNDSGPVLVQLEDATWLINEDGSVEASDV